MNASDWISLAALVVAVPGATVGVLSYRYTKKAAASAAQSADEAAALGAIEADRRAEEKERWHHELGPTPPGEFVAELFKGMPTDSLISTITVQRGYRVQALAVRDHGNITGAGLGNVLHPNREERFHFEQWPPGSKQPVTKEIWIRFWPPLPGDGVDVWTCPCGKPTGESLEGEGHWEWRVKVTYDPPTPPASTPAAPPPTRRGGLFS